MRHKSHLNRLIENEFKQIIFGISKLLNDPIDIEAIFDLVGTLEERVEKLFKHFPPNYILKRVLHDENDARKIRMGPSQKPV